MKDLNINNIYIDTNVLVGAFTRPNSDENRCWMYIGKMKGKRFFVSSLSVAQFVALLQKKFNKDVIEQYVKQILAKVNIVSFTEDDIEQSLLADGRDLEDNMQYVLSQKVKCANIITQNKKDFKYININVLSAKDIRILNLTRKILSNDLIWKQSK